MRTVGSYEAKTHLPRLLDEVAKGETITITKNGKPVALLIPAEEVERERRRQAVESMLRFKKDHPHIRLPEGMTIKDMIKEGRRF
ncbi:MAG TPA: type II toxin-antitoxin system prevent-host-death family antitoxin [Chloroflexota bacterium]|jgi:prevent-host-death family protein|nr:type II toxin-antitoxin system prevent-host-death family antitoxin [Chloroflexota bacterium]